MGISRGLSSVFTPRRASARARKVDPHHEQAARIRRDRSNRPDVLSAGFSADENARRAAPMDCGRCLLTRADRFGHERRSNHCGDSSFEHHWHGFGVVAERDCVIDDALDLRVVE